MTALLAGLAVLVLGGLPAPARLELATGFVWKRWWAVPALGLGVLVMGPAASGVAAVLALLVRRSWRRRRAAAGRDAERLGAAEALAVLVAELRAGRAPSDALGVAADVAVGPLAEALATGSAATTFGGEVPMTLVLAADTSAVPELLRGLAACWQVSSATGSSLAQAVDRLAEGLRAEHAQRLAVDAELAGPRATAGLLAALPLVGIALAAGLGAQPVHVLLHTPVGLACLVAGLGLDAIGLWWTGRLVAAAGGSR